MQICDADGSTTDTMECKKCHRPLTRCVWMWSIDLQAMHRMHAHYFAAFNVFLLLLRNGWKAIRVFLLFEWIARLSSPSQSSFVLHFFFYFSCTFAFIMFVHIYGSIHLRNGYTKKKSDSFLIAVMCYCVWCALYVIICNVHSTHTYGIDNRDHQRRWKPLQRQNNVKYFFSYTHPSVNTIFRIQTSTWVIFVWHTKRHTIAFVAFIQ